MGIAGGLARQLALRLKAYGHDVFGIDKRPWMESGAAGIELFPVDLRKRAAEDVFRRKRPDVVIHMATVTALTMSAGEERYKINLGGTRAVFDHCHQWGVKHVIFVGRHTYYGAGPDSPLYHTEDEAPQALDAFPELADLVAADLYAATALWRMPTLRTTLLRLVYTLGPSRTGTLATFLKGTRMPMVMGYDPLFQFLWEDDAITAIRLALEKRPVGVFNVAGPSPVPLSIIARTTGRSPRMLPPFLIARLSGRMGFPQLPTGALEHLKYPVVVDDRAFRAATGYQHQVDEVEALKRYRDLS